MRLRTAEAKSAQSTLAARKADALLVWLDRNQGNVASALLGWTGQWRAGTLEYVLAYHDIKPSPAVLGSAPLPGDLETRLHWDFPVIHVDPADPAKPHSKPKATVVTRADALLVARTVRPDYDAKKKEWALYYFCRYRWFVVIDPSLELLAETMKRVRPILEAATGNVVLVVTSNSERGEMLAKQGVDVVMVPKPDEPGFQFCGGSRAREQWAKAAREPTESSHVDPLADLAPHYPDDARQTLAW